MATFYVVGMLDLIILVANSKVVQVTKNVLYAMFATMFAFQQESLHVSKSFFLH
jgi:hypothetical protein